MPAEPFTSNPVARRPPQFSLRTLFWLIAAFSALFAAMTAVGMVWSLLLLMFVALVVAHVLGNAIGTRLRNEATRRSDQSPPHGEFARTQAASPIFRRAETPVTPLRERRPLGQMLFVFVAAGGVIGAMLGRFALTHIQWQPPAVSDVVVGIFSCAVLGAIAGFMASTFFKVALWPAVKFFFSRK